jgi:hypothetical protein
MMNDEIKNVLLALRTLVAFAAKLTPTAYDDLLVAWIDYVLGEAPMPAEPHPMMLNASALEAEGVTTYGAIDWSKLPWDKLLPLILPIIERRLPEIIGALISQLSKWLEAK